MYLIGLIQTCRPDVLINPVDHRSVEKLYQWLDKFFNSEDFSLDLPITPESIERALQAEKPVQVNINGYQVAVLFGKEKIIQNATSRFVYMLPRYEEEVDVNKIENLAIPD